MAAVNERSPYHSCGDSDKLVRGVAFKYGRNSSEYEIAGGVRESDRIRKSRLTRLKSSIQETSY
ncbi:hypothetical protein PI95_012020 [Hassallia byssoidea VB512170]|uniref:Uncharacterized protein n=1 Tax=Hassallia byssoidea VB512170 TaxID=1304833 RepID=A0A846H9X9_9CYAN|nr:hypothetical protein [Hassalia byssoidea]NEU73271.1 hypothetical protein [Hassalia byssoidea VB512170]